MNLKRIVYIILFLLLIFLSCVVYLESTKVVRIYDSQFIKKFVLLGAPKYTSADDINKVLINSGELTSYFKQDVKVLKDKIKSIPWVKNVFVRKIFPDILTIAVEDYEAVASWNDDFYLAQDGTVFRLNKSIKMKPNHSLPNLYGDDNGSYVLDSWYKLKTKFKTLIDETASLKINSRQAYEIKLKDGILLRLGEGDIEHKIENYITIFPQIEIPKDKKIDYIDLRYKDGLAVGFIDI